MANDIDPDLFNNDPKYEKERNVFDKMFEGAVARALARKQKETPTEEPNFFDKLFGGKKE